MDGQAFYTQTGSGQFDSSPLTAGPWSAASQHGGPPSALLAREIERYQPRDGHRLARISIDILTPVPVAPLTVQVEEIRTGKRVQLLQATAQAGGRMVLVGRAWRMAAAAADFPVAVPGSVPDGDEPDEPTPQAFTFPDGLHTDGYLSAIDWSFEDGGFAIDGPARAWARPRVALVAGEAMTPWQRVLTVGDSGSGISACAPPARHPAINCDFTVVLHRDPVGSWVGMDARTVVTPGQGAMTQTTVFDAAGPAGLATQTLVV
ncbi:thioesterase family protein [Mycobacterium sp. UM_Kg1]|uniref:thioesterase family protein n=1 Tax=Mycobacterium sp. UM_Kg1 TaxID=1545691 RepID=UPI00061B0C20|nr:thioesterase family protein [Mycobacterium sp. UM_Kg1]